MNQIAQIPREHLQILFIRHTKSELIKMLGIKEHEYYILKKEQRLFTGCEALKKMPSQVLMEVYRHFKSRAEMARFFRVSVSFLTSVFNEAFHEYSNPFLLQINSCEQMETALGLYGSKSIVAKLMGINLRKMSHLCKKYGVKHSMLSKVRSGYESSKGLAAEKEIEQLRGGHILENMNEKDPRACYDFVDDKYGRVNVKASKSYYSRRRRDRYAKFNLNGGCDTYALYVYDEDFKELLYYFFVKTSDYLCKTTSFYRKDTRVPALIEHEKCVFYEKHRRTIKK